MRLFTIGFTKKSAETFFNKLQNAGVKRLMDIRLNNVSQLAGFAKRDDLRYFLKTLCGIEYVPFADLAPTRDILQASRMPKSDWVHFERQFIHLIKARRIEETTPRELMDGGCLLCSEDSPRQCHRRIVAEYLKEKWGDVEIVHIT